MPQNPGLEIPTPPSGHDCPWQRTSKRKATLLRSKQEERSVDTIIDDGLSPMIVHGLIFDETLEPPASKPETII
jgi:hypothetical protein